MWYYINNGKSTYLVDEQTDWLFNEGFKIIRQTKTLSGDEYLVMLEDMRQLRIQQHGF